MNTGLGSTNPTIVSAFHTALLHQGLVVLALVAAGAVAWNVVRAVQVRRGSAPVAPALTSPEPIARRWLRLAFGIIWIFDGILQAQASMPLGMVPQGIQPTASASPTWVQHVVNAGTTVWSYHPVPAAAAAVWIQIGIGIWLIVAPRGPWSRLGGTASLLWGLVVWVFGEAFGGLFAPGLSWLFGAPGAVLFYCAAGALIALPERSWSTARLGRGILRVSGLFLVGMAVLQAWPGRGFWEGRTATGAGTLTTMVQQMAQTNQPRFLSSWVSAFAAFDGAHGWAVNLVVVIVLAGVGVAFLSARPLLARVGLGVITVVGLATWVLVQDLGFLGGVGTDPNSMIPALVVFVGGYLALTRLPAPVAEGVVPIADRAPVPSWRVRLVSEPAYALRWVAALAAMGIVLVGAVPMAAAASNPNADPILIQAVDGPPGTANVAAPGFHLVNQDGKAVTSTSLRGKVVALTFLDDVCTSVCPIIAQEFRATDRMLGSASRHVEFVAINTNPRFLAPDYLAAFDRQEELQGLSNWLFLTGSLRQLQHTWSAYGIEVQYLPGGAMIGHGLYASVISSSGRTRWIYSADPGPGTQATQSSFSALLASAVRSQLPPS